MGKQEEISGLTGESAQLDQDQRLLAATGHFGVVLPVVGLVAPATVYILNRSKPLVRYHALQSIAFQAVLVVVYCVLMTAFGFGYMFAELSAHLSDNNRAPALFVALPLALSCTVFLVYVVAVAYGILGGITVLSNRHFRYLLAGDWTDRFLREPAPGTDESDKAEEDYEEGA